MIRIALTAVSLAHAAAAGPVVLEQGPVTATVTERPAAARDPGAVEIRVTSNGRTSSWTYRGLALDREAAGIPPVEIRRARERDYLFVHARARGAPCCWSLLVFDLERLRPVGTRLGSRAPIPLVADRAGCELGALAAPIPIGGAPPVGPQALHCFDGSRFGKAGRPATAAPHREPGR